MRRYRECTRREGIEHVGHGGAGRVERTTAVIESEDETKRSSAMASGSARIVETDIGAFRAGQVSGDEVSLPGLTTPFTKSDTVGESQVRLAQQVGWSKHDRDSEFASRGVAWAPHHEPSEVAHVLAPAS